MMSQFLKNRYRPKYLENRPDKSKVAAGLACGSIYTICYNLKIGDIILCPDGKGEYVVGEIRFEITIMPLGKFFSTGVK